MKRAPPVAGSSLPGNESGKSKAGHFSMPWRGGKREVLPRNLLRRRSFFYRRSSYSLSCNSSSLPQACPPVDHVTKKSSFFVLLLLGKKNRSCSEGGTLLSGGVGRRCRSPTIRWWVEGSSRGWGKYFYLRFSMREGHEKIRKVL